MFHFGGEEAMVNVEILYFDNCPTHEAAHQLVKEVCKQEGVKPKVTTINIIDEEQAKKHAFIGSPTIRIEGKDVEKASRGASYFGRKCRVYMNNGQPSGLPSKEMIRDTIREVLYEKSKTCCR